MIGFRQLNKLDKGCMVCAFATHIVIAAALGGLAFGGKKLSLLIFKGPNFLRSPWASAGWISGAYIAAQATYTVWDKYSWHHTAVIRDAKGQTAQLPKAKILKAKGSNPVAWLTQTSLSPFGLGDLASKLGAAVTTFKEPATVDLGGGRAAYLDGQGGVTCGGGKVLGEGMYRTVTAGRQIGADGRVDVAHVPVDANEAQLFALVGDSVEGIVPTYGVYRDLDGGYVAIQQKATGDLTGDGWNKDHADRYVGQLLSGMAHVHTMTYDGEPIIHRDIKLANVLFDADTDSVSIADFGIMHGRPQAGSCTLQYLPPEALTVKMVLVYVPISQKADVWSAGLVSAMLMTGERNEQAFLADFLMWPFARQETIDAKIESLGVGERGTALLKMMLQVDPAKRCTMQEAKEFWNPTS